MPTFLTKSIAMSLLFIASMTLQGCLNMATTGAQAVYNRHSIQKNLNDQYITMRLYQALYVKSNQFKDTNISIATFNGEVLLTGQTPKKWQRIAAERIAKEMPEVTQVYNLIQISNPTSTLIRMSDAWLTTKVKSKLIASDDVDATQIKVVTENGTVYLMGILPPQDAEAAVDIASNTEGVQRVVKVFYYLHVSKKAYEENMLT